jgi:hypothetical protein
LDFAAGRQARITRGAQRHILAADFLVLIVLLGELTEAGFDSLGVAAPAAAAETEHQVKRRLLLDVVVGQGAAVLELLARKDEALLARRDACSMWFRQWVN